MIKITDKTLCVGCGACIEKCPKSCINAIYDEEGFLYPEVDEKRCINCNVCEHTCPVLKDCEKSAPLQVSGCTSKDNSLLKVSSSGGLFTLLVKKFFDSYPNAHIYGAAYNADFSVSHIRIDSFDDIGLLQGSKYVQSDCTAVYKEIKELLDKSESVYFSGTPCQIAALKSFLGKEYSGLFTQAILCHGVPSPALWSKFVDELQSQSDSPIKQISFRDKEKGWERYRFSVIFEDGTGFVPEKHDKWFTTAFGADLSLRPACYHCRFKYPNYFSDITIGDFWNVKQFCPSAYNEQGVSLAIVTTQKGLSLLNEISDNIVVHNVTIEQAINSQKGIAKNLEVPKNRNGFWSDIKNGDPKAVTAKYTKRPVHKIIRANLAKLYRNLIYKLHK